MDIIRTNQLSKSFGKIRAVDAISFHVRKGEIYGFLGLNGAGKTTTIRMLLGMIRPSKGEARLNGIRIDPGKLDVWKKVGYLVETPHAYPDLTVEENLEIMRRLHLISERSATKKVMEKLSLMPYRDMKARNLSLGNAQRLGIAKALMHDPDILILDEPANGLDPAGIVEIRELLKELASQKGVTVFISSHILGEISRFATRIGIIHEGRLIQESDMESLEKLRRKCLQVSSRDPEKTAGILKEKGYSIERSNGKILEIQDKRAREHPEDIASLLVVSGCPPTLLKVEEEDLESYFLKIIHKKQV